LKLVGSLAEYGDANMARMARMASMAGFQLNVVVIIRA
jgi:hypothetical protein